MFPVKSEIIYIHFKFIFQIALRDDKQIYRLRLGLMMTRHFSTLSSLSKFSSDCENSEINKQITGS